uniref:Exosome complex component Csl4 n=1 Tax=Ignisphaera aggregans TaxID=334771 RepID=A0A7C2V9L0_9CREN
MSSNMVLPGDPICKEEEYLGYRNVYIDERGNVRAAVIGLVTLDKISRRVSVKPFKELRIPRAGDIVIGEVASMRDDIAFVELLGYDISKTFKHTYTSILHISQVTTARNESMYNYVRLGDLIKAKVLNDYLPLLISIKEPRLGVILAYCSRCGAQLYLNNSRLICPVCGNVEQRKLSIDYMLVRGKKNAKA